MITNVYYTILSTLQTYLSNNVLTNTVLRFNLEQLKTDAFPLIMVAPSQDGEQMKERQFSKNEIWTYPVEVMLIDSANKFVSAGFPEYMLLREQIRNTLFEVPSTFGLPPTIFNMRIKVNAASRLAEWSGTNYKMSYWLLSLDSSETRLGN